MTHFGFLSTYPPTRCGLATFSGALAAGGARDSVVVRVLDEPRDRPHPVVVGRNEYRGAESTIAALSTYQQARRLHILERVTVLTPIPNPTPIRVPA